MEKTLSNINRRNFIRFTGITGAGLIIGLSIKGENGVATVAALKDDAALYDLTPFIIIEKNGTITLFNPRPEIGQGRRRIGSFVRWSYHKTNWW